MSKTHATIFETTKSFENNKLTFWPSRENRHFVKFSDKRPFGTVFLVFRGPAAGLKKALFCAAAASIEFLLSFYNKKLKIIAAAASG